MILVGAIVAILLLCICYGFCRFHSRPVASETPATANSRPPRRSVVPLPSPAPQTRGPYMPGFRSPSFLTSPLAVNLNRNSVANQSTPSAMKTYSPIKQLAQVPPMALASLQSGHLPHLVLGKTISQHTCVSDKVKSCQPSSALQQRRQSLDGPATRMLPTGYHHNACRTPRSASTEFREKRKTPSALSSAGSALEPEGSNVSTMTSKNIETTSISAILASHSTQV